MRTVLPLPSAVPFSDTRETHPGSVPWLPLPLTRGPRVGEGGTAWWPPHLSAGSWTQACKRGNSDIVRLVIERGADCNILSKHRNSAMHFAKQSDNVLVYDLLKSHLDT